jgi:hypothetical protein
MTTGADMSWDDIKALVAELAVQSKETDRKFQETDRKFQETRELVENISRRLGDLGNRLGEFVEEMVEPALVELFRARGLDVSEVYRRVASRRHGEAIEIDLLVVDGDVAVAVECKSRLIKEDVERHVERMSKIKRLLPKYADMRIQGAVAGMVVDEDAVQAAEAAGLWVLAPSGETMRLLNEETFQPRTW